MLKIIIKIAFLALLPTLLILGSRVEFVSNYLVDHNYLDPLKTDEFKWLLLLAGTTISLLGTSVEMAVTNKKLVDTKKINSEMARFIKNLQISIMKKQFNLNSHELHTRVFIPSSGIKAFINRKVFNKVTLKLHELDGVSDPFVGKSLSFRANPDPQGLVGQAWHEGQCKTDPDVKLENYPNLDKTQQQLTAGVRFCTAAPILGASEQRLGVLSMDSNEEFDFDPTLKPKWELQMKYLVSIIDKHSNL